MSEIIPGEMTMKQAMEIQSKQLAEWMPKLSAACYLALVRKIDLSNFAGYLSPYEVFRGESMTNFISNWKP